MAIADKVSLNETDRRSYFLIVSDDLLCFVIDLQYVLKHFIIGVCIISSQLL